jgi:hypothetical protein
VSGIFAHGRIGRPNIDLSGEMSSATVRVRPAMTGCDQLNKFIVFHLPTNSNDKVNDRVTSKHGDSGDRCLINCVNRRNSSRSIHSITVQDCLINREKHESTWLYQPEWTCRYGISRTF